MSELSLIGVVVALAAGLSWLCSRLVLWLRARGVPETRMPAPIMVLAERAFWLQRHLEAWQDKRRRGGR